MLEWRSIRSASNWRIACAGYFYRKGEPKELCAALAYFSGMEAIQAYTYSVIDLCGDSRNKWATIAGYVHIAFQPVFINALSMHFIPDGVRQRIKRVVYALSLLAAAFFLLRLYPFSWSTPCSDTKYSLPLCDFRPSVPFCGTRTCSISGKWHIAWEIPANFSRVFDNAYLFAGFILPIVYGSWRMTIYLILAGPFLSWLTTDNANEWAAVWCLYSIGFLSVIIKSPLRRLMYVKKWYPWRFLKG